MPIDESLITAEVLDNTLKREVFPEVKVEAEGTYYLDHPQGGNSVGKYLFTEKNHWIDQK